VRAAIVPAMARKRLRQRKGVGPAEARGTLSFRQMYHRLSYQLGLMELACCCFNFLKNSTGGGGFGTGPHVACRRNGGG
jgi:hypothetical protein